MLLQNPLWCMAAVLNIPSQDSEGPIHFLDFRLLSRLQCRVIQMQGGVPGLSLLESDMGPVSWWDSRREAQLRGLDEQVLPCLQFSRRMEKTGMKTDCEGLEPGRGAALDKWLYKWHEESSQKGSCRTWGIQEKKAVNNDGEKSNGK